MKGNILFCKTSFQLEKLKNKNPDSNIYHLQDVVDSKDFNSELDNQKYYSLFLLK